MSATRTNTSRRSSARRKSLYELSRLHSQGLLNREDYLETRRALLGDILSGRQVLGQGHYASLTSSSDATVHYSEAAIAERRREAREQQARLSEFREYASQVRRTRQRRFLWLTATGVGVILVGFAWYAWR